MYQQCPSALDIKDLSDFLGISESDYDDAENTVTEKS